MAMILSLSGCDPVQTSHQKATIRVHNLQQQPVAGVKVKIYESWNSWKSWINKGVTDSKTSPLYQRWNDFVPSSEATTDNNGIAEFELKMKALRDGKRGNIQSPNRDIISNREYVCLGSQFQWNGGG